jgi:hypothetical protein
MVYCLFIRYFVSRREQKVAVFFLFSIFISNIVVNSCESHLLKSFQSPNNLVFVSHFPLNTPW